MNKQLSYSEIIEMISNKSDLEIQNLLSTKLVLAKQVVKGSKTPIATADMKTKSGDAPSGGCDGGWWVYNPQTGEWICWRP